MTHPAFHDPTLIPACASRDTELFFPLGEDGPGPITGVASGQLEHARAICRSCPLARPCLDYALATGQVGVWGATTTAERRALRQRHTNSGTARADSDAVRAVPAPRPAERGAPVSTPHAPEHPVRARRRVRTREHQTR